ncbi:hypothetical protein CRUP_008682, partial [Coryphaenoides rupestris]
FSSWQQAPQRASVAASQSRRLSQEWQGGERRMSSVTGWLRSCSFSAGTSSVKSRSKSSTPSRAPPDSSRYSLATGSRWSTFCTRPAGRHQQGEELSTQHSQPISGRWTNSIINAAPGGYTGSLHRQEVTGRSPASSPACSPHSLDGCYFSPTLVTDWFWGVVSQAVEELRRNPKRGIPVPERLERNGPLTTIILQVGSSRVLYDLVPVVSFRGWPAVAQGWLTANHFWDGKITEEEAISGFYLLPCCSPLAGRPDREWRLAFSRSEAPQRASVAASQSRRLSQEWQGGERRMSSVTGWLRSCSFSAGTSSVKSRSKSSTPSRAPPDSSRYSLATGSRWSTFCTRPAGRHQQGE